MGDSITVMREMMLAAYNRQAAQVERDRAAYPDYDVRWALAHEEIESARDTLRSLFYGCALPSNNETLLSVITEKVSTRYIYEYPQSSLARKEYVAEALNKMANVYLGLYMREIVDAVAENMGESLEVLINEICGGEYAEAVLGGVPVNDVIA